MHVWAFALRGEGSAKQPVMVFAVSDTGSAVIDGQVVEFGTRSSAVRHVLSAIRDAEVDGYKPAGYGAFMDVPRLTASLFDRVKWPRIYDDDERDSVALFRELLSVSFEQPHRVSVAVTAGGVSQASGYRRGNGQLYYPREVGGMEDVSLVRTARKHGQTVCLFGAPGCGKTALFEAAEPDVAGTTLVGSRSTEYADFVGRYLPDPDVPGAYRWFDGPLITAALNGLPFFVDEMALIDPQETSVLFPLMDGRNQVIVPERPDSVGGPLVCAQPGFTIWGAYNPYVPGARVSEALWSRFDVKLEYTTDYGLARALGVPAAVVNASIKLDAKLRDDYDPVSWAPQMRELLRFVTIRDTYGEPFAYQNLIGEAPAEDRVFVAQEFTAQCGDGQPMPAGLVTGGAWRV